MERPWTREEIALTLFGWLNPTTWREATGTDRIPAREQDTERLERAFALADLVIEKRKEGG